MAVDARETEIKYEATEGITLPSFGDLPQVTGTRRAPDEQLEAEYFDTADHRLIEAGITLRRRRGGHDAGWQLKLPASAHTRREIAAPLGRAGQAVPQELAGLVRVHTRGARLRRVARISTRRERLLLLDDAGQCLAEVASDDVAARTVGDPGSDTRWREVEFELKAGDRDLLAAADRLLRRNGLRRASQLPKLARALGRREPSPEAAPSLTKSAPAGRVILGYFADQVAALKADDPLVRMGEPDSVHQMRTIIRRLRSTLASFGRMLRASQTDPLDEELRWFGSVLGAARDVEVLEAHLAAQVDGIPEPQLIGPVMARVGGHFTRLGEQARAEVLEVLDSARYFALLDRLDRLVASPRFTARASRPASRALLADLRGCYARTRRRMKRALKRPPGAQTEIALHRARKAAKRARYAGEALVSAFGPDASRFARQMKRLQSLLGEHQDSVIARQADRDLAVAAHLAGESAFTYGVMYERDDLHAKSLARQAGSAWRKASRARYRRWLR